MLNVLFTDRVERDDDEDVDLVERLLLDDDRLELDEDRETVGRVGDDRVGAERVGADLLGVGRLDVARLDVARLDVDRFTTGVEERPVVTDLEVGSGDGVDIVGRDDLELVELERDELDRVTLGTGVGRDMRGSEVEEERLAGKGLGVDMRGVENVRGVVGNGVGVDRLGLEVDRPRVELLVDERPFVDDVPGRVGSLPIEVFPDDMVVTAGRTRPNIVLDDELDLEPELVDTDDGAVRPDDPIWDEVTPIVGGRVRELGGTELTKRRSPI